MRSKSEIQAFEKDGVVCLRGTFDQDWIHHLQNWTEIAMADPGPNAEEYTKDGRSGRAFNDLDLARRHPGFRKFVFESPAAELAGQIMNSRKVNFFYDQLIVKEPATKEITPWHQDQPYWAVSGRQVCSIWLPLDPVPREVGVQYVAGSHHWPAHNPRHFADDSPYADTGLPELPDIDKNRDGYTIKTWEMQPGDCLVFHAMTVHGAPGNLGYSSRRRALATRWAGDDARYCVREGEVGIPTRDPGLAHGDLLDCEDFPVVWQDTSK